MTKYFKGKKLYRSRNGIFFGVCQGLADWRDMPVFYIRLILIICAIGFFPTVLIYLLAGLILPLEPHNSGFRSSERFDENNESKFGKEKQNRFNEDKESDWDKRFYGHS